MVDRPVNVLYVEDDEADADFARTAFGELGGQRIKMSLVMDGEEALRVLGLGDKNAPASATLIPDIILLDLNLPRIHGKDVLKAVKQSPNLKQIPVLILSTSQHQQDVDELYSLGASGYFQKPSTYREYQQVFGAIYNYWAVTAALPRIRPH